MLRSEKKIRDLSDILNKDSNIVINGAVELLRQEKPFEGAIGLLVAYYDMTDDYSIRKTIASFMNDLKDQAVCEEVIREIRKRWKPDTIAMLVSSCWQSGLDYSRYSSDLTKVFLSADYITAIECLTVIEESAEELSRAAKDAILKMLEESPVSPLNEKKALTLELISILAR
jgi:hypothetical protein